MPIRPRLHDLSPRRVALIKPSALGDIIHSLPVLTALRQRYPEAHIAWVANRAYAELLHGHPDLDAVLPFDRAGSTAGVMAVKSAAIKVRHTSERRPCMIIARIQTIKGRSETRHGR